MADHDPADVGEAGEPRRGALVALALIAAIAGVAVGLVGGAFRWCLERADDLRGLMLDAAHTLGWWGFVVPMLVVAACAGLAALIVRAVPLSSGSGIQHVEAVYRGSAAPAGWTVLPAKFVGGLLAIGSGMVLGREGPTVHMGATLGGQAGRLARRGADDVRALQAALGGAGLAVAFNAPIGGALFVFEEVTRSFRLRVLVPTAIGVAAAVGFSRLIIGDGADFQVAAVSTPELGVLPAFLVFGLVTGLLGAAYNRLVIGGLDLVAGIRRVPAPVKAAVIGGIIGIALFIDPYAARGGDDLTQLLLDSHGFAISSLILFVAIRFFAGPLSYAAGTPGGLFAPLLAVGALWGVLYAHLIELLAPGTDLHVAFAIVGMATFFAATVRAPFTGIVIVIEMTAITAVTVPMIAAAACAVLVATLVRSTPIYDTLRDRMPHTP